MPIAGQVTDPTTSRKVSPEPVVPSSEPPPNPAAPSADRKRVRAMVGRSRRWTGAERARFEKQLQSRCRTSRVVEAGFDIAELDVHVGGGILAGAVAFRLFLFVVPFHRRYRRESGPSVPPSVLR